MSYKTYTTEAIVCGSVHHNTSDKNYLLFTKDAGMVWASARSVREERSKQRCALQDFSHIRVSLIKGKSGWRVGSVESYGNAFMDAESRMQRGRVNFTVAQLRRYVHGEIPLPKVYDDAFELMQSMETAAEQNIQVQQIFSVRLLAELGYIAPAVAWVDIVTAPSIADALEVYSNDKVSAVTSAIQMGMQASHL